MDEPRRLQRLSQLDLSNLRIEDHGLPMHVAALMFLDQAGPSGELDLVNLIVSNVPGPRIPLYVAGAKITEIFQIGAVQGNVTISVGAFSYAGQLNLDVVGDPTPWPTSRSSPAESRTR